MFVKLRWLVHYCAGAVLALLLIGSYLTRLTKSEK